MLAKPIGAISAKDAARFDGHTEAQSSGCLNWTAAVASGYGQFLLNKRPTRAHRVAWARLHGEPPADMQIDHLCRNRECVNPDHLELVTHAVNGQRAMDARYPDKDRCVNGHLYAEVGSRIAPGRRRPTCKQCKRDVAKRIYYRKNATS